MKPFESQPDPPEHIYRIKRAGKTYYYGEDTNGKPHPALLQRIQDLQRANANMAARGRPVVPIEVFKYKLERQVPVERPLTWDAIDEQPDDAKWKAVYDLLRRSTP